MDKERITFRGRFLLWSYTVGHGRLLLRSTKSIERATQVDILFNDVGVIRLPVSFDDPVIAEDDMGLAAIPQSDLGASDHRGRKLYRVEGRDVIGYIVAAALAVHEAEREYFEPSPLLD
jgi:hypothetical protein